MPLKQKKATISKKKGGERQWRIRLQRSAEFEGTNNSPVVISLASTVGSHLFVDIFFISHSSTNWPEGLEVHIHRNHHQTFPGKQKKIHQQGSFGRRSILSLPPLDHAYFCICGVPRWCLHSGRWRLKTHSLARCRLCWTSARPFSGYFGFIQIYREPTVGSFWFWDILYTTQWYIF